MANWPAMRPTFTTGEAPAKVSTTAICRKTRKKSRMLSRRMLGEAFGAIAALQQEGVARGDLCKRGLELPRLAGENERREPGKLPLDRRERIAHSDRRGPARQAVPAMRRATSFSSSRFDHGELRDAEERCAKEESRAISRPSASCRSIHDHAVAIHQSLGTRALEFKPSPCRLAG